jgi:hypothetical protein
MAAIHVKRSTPRRIATVWTVGIRYPAEVKEYLFSPQRPDRL